MVISASRANRPPMALSFDQRPELDRGLAGGRRTPLERAGQGARTMRAALWT